MSAQVKLERAIEAAHRAGDTTRLHVLQGEYRSGGYTIERIHPGATMALVERASSRSKPALTPGERASAERAAYLCKIDEATRREGAKATAERDVYLRRIRTEQTSPRPLPIISRASRAAAPVVFTADAWEGVRDLEYGGGFEVAGALYGREEAGELVVYACAPTGERFGYSRMEAWLDPDQMLGHKFHDGVLGWTLVGDIHSHEHTIGDDAEPSGTDLRHWHTWAKNLGRSYLGCILTARGGAYEYDLYDWTGDPHISSWQMEHMRKLAHPCRGIIIERSAA